MPAPLIQTCVRNLDAFTITTSDGRIFITGHCNWCGQPAGRSTDEFGWSWWHRNADAVIWCDGDEEAYFVAGPGWL